MIAISKKTMLRSTLVLVCSICAALQSATRIAAGEMVLDLDPAQSEVSFTLPDVVHTVHGTFKLKAGSISFDPATGKAAGEVVVDVTTGDSGSAGRDRRMHKDILESSRYPTAVFALDHFNGQFGPDGSADLQVHGLFKIHGAEHDVTFPMRIQMQGDQITATTHFVVPYVKWGMKNPSNFLLHVSDKVQIEIRASGHTHPAAG
jgi:polyisoprenoid-binding protein YceI